jgi:hypothetical protein
VNIGVHDGILDKKHVDTMGQAVWLYLWCLKHQTRSNGLVLGGSPLTYSKMNKQLGQSPRTVKRWLLALRKAHYIQVTYLAHKRLRITVLKAKKFNFKKVPQRPQLSAKSGPYETELSAISGPYEGGLSAKSGPYDGSYGPEMAHSSRAVVQHEKELKAEVEGTRNGNGSGYHPTTATVDAFRSLDCEPFGPIGFQELWTEEVQNFKGGSWVDAMERTMQKCQAKRILIPQRFTAFKRRLEKIEAESAFRRTPL